MSSTAKRKLQSRGIAECASRTSDVLLLKCGLEIMLLGGQCLARYRHSRGKIERLCSHLEASSTSQIDTSAGWLRDSVTTLSLAVASNWLYKHECYSARTLMVCKKEELSTVQPCSSCCAQLNFREVSAVCPTLKLNGERRLLLLRFRPHTVLSLVRNPESAPNRSNTPLSVLASRHQCLSHINEQFGS